MGRWGTYYPPTYKSWLFEAGAMLKPFWKIAEPVKYPVAVLVDVVTKRPKKLTRELPRPDVDNYVKAALDIITKAQLIWHDDDQVDVLYAHKRYAEEGEDPHTFIRVAAEEENLLKPEGEDVYDLSPVRRISLDRARRALDRKAAREYGETK